MDLVSLPGLVGNSRIWPSPGAAPAAPVSLSMWLQSPHGTDHGVLDVPFLAKSASLDIDQAERAFMSALCLTDRDT